MVSLLPDTAQLEVLLGEEPRLRALAQHYGTRDINFANTTGTGNTALGAGAGSAQTTGDFNIYVNNVGVAGESDTIRIGIGHLRAFIAGISGVNVTGSAVVVDANGQLGIVVSSRRFKEDIRDMGEASDALMQLRPVMFRYKKEHAGGERPVQPGLIAEEVAEVYPDLVTHSAEGEIQSVQYHKLSTMLLNELQKQQKHIADLTARLEAMEAQRK